LVSVVIPCYRHAHFLPEAIQSVLRQDYPQLEVIVIDDGSPDPTSAVAARYPEVRCVRQENQGLPGARNAGWRVARGQFIVFLDADDFLLPGALRAGSSCLLENPGCGFASGDYHYVNADGSFRNKIPQRYTHDNQYEALLRDNYIGMCAAVMFRRSALEASGGYDVTLPACEDYDLYLRIARLHPVCCHRAVVAAYRQHGTNMSGRASLMLPTVLRVLRRQWPHVRGNPRLKTAYREGRRYWQALYGAALWAETCSSDPEQARLASVLPILARYAPGFVARQGTRRILGKGLRFARRVLGATGLRRLLVARADAAPEVGRIDFGDFRRLEPISRHFGYDRGTPVDRYYVERFLEENAARIAGRVLEIGDDSYTRRFGGDRVAIRDVLHVTPGHPGATFTGDLTSAPQLPSDAFDCIILTQTLHLIYDVRTAIETLHRILKPGGVVLATVPGISQTSVDEWAASWFWSFTRLSIRNRFCEVFAEDRVTVQAWGNVLAAISFLQGLSVAELRPEELNHRDPQYEMLLTVRAEKEAP
jgi:GT2 family glycosyltransferase/SAM-dependent methyltransferase